MICDICGEQEMAMYTNSVQVVGTDGNKWTLYYCLECADSIVEGNDLVLVNGETVRKDPHHDSAKFTGISVHL